MSKISSSPQRGSFSKETYHRRLEEDPNDAAAKSMIDLYNQMFETKQEQESSEEWKKNNLEYDLRSTEWILEKVRESRVYSQNLYAALCNNDFQKLEVLPILKEETWGCSWRYAGGIVADMREKGDYIDWYCSGIKFDEPSTEEFWNCSIEEQQMLIENRSFVGEGIVTDEIREDLKKLGWIILPSKDE